MPDIDTLISQPQLRRLMGGVSDSTIWRWRTVGILPKPLSINGRNYFRQADLKVVFDRLATDHPRMSE